jgi:rhomboid protease GluP
MQTAMAVLESRSKAQALDWSLVLISQGIESLIVQRQEDGAWTLELSESDLRRATEAIAAYERENATVWRQPMKWTGLLFDLRGGFWFAALAAFHFFAAVSATDFQTAGLMDRTAVQHGEWWRLFTAVTLHADIAHLAANVTTGIVFLGLAMGCFGWGNALLLSFLGGAIGNVGTFFVHNYSLGASGMVMAALGLLTAHSLSFAKHEKRAVWIGRGVIAGCLLVVLLGFSPKSDVVAHVGGFIGGVVLGIVAMRFQNVLRRQSCNAGATLLCAAMVLFTWWLALR